MSFWQKLTVIILSLFFAVLFYENFLFSKSFTILHLREIDDIAFQGVLRQFHEDIISFRPDRFIKLNAYGYGWIFWIIVGVTTFPFYLLGLLTDFYLPLIVIPRDISLLFTIGATFFIYKTFGCYSKNEFLKFIAMMLLISLPAYGYFALRFGTIAQVMFFSALAFYLTVRKENYEKQDLKYIALAAGICVGTKLNGALILPVIGFIMADRLGWKPSRENFKKAGYFLSRLAFFIVLFGNPSLFLAPFKPKYLFHYLDSLKYNSHLEAQKNWFGNLREFIDGGYLNFYVALAIGALFLLNIFGKNKHKRELIFIGVWLVFSSCLLAKVMAMGPLYVLNYILVVMYLLVFSVLYFERWGNAGEVMAALLLIVSITLGYKNLINAGQYSDLRYLHLQNDPEILAKIEIRNEMAKIIPDPALNKSQKVTALMDARAIFPYSHFERSNLKIRFISNNDVQALKEEEQDFDYIILYRDSMMFGSEEEFSKLVLKMDVVQKLKRDQVIKERIENRQTIQELMKSGKLENSAYKIIFDRENILVFHSEIN